MSPLPLAQGYGIIGNCLFQCFNCRYAAVPEGDIKADLQIK